jgi:hypothetical protein
MLLNSQLKRVTLTAMALCLVLSGSAVASDRDAVERAVLDYVEGVEQGKPELIERGVHPHLAKFGFGRDREGNYKIYPMTFDELVELAANMKKEGHVPENPTHSVEIYEVLDKTASIKLTAFWGVDYMHLAKYDDEWKIVQVLWQSHPPE